MLSLEGVLSLGGVVLRGVVLSRGIVLGGIVLGDVVLWGVCTPGSRKTGGTHPTGMVSCCSHNSFYVS